MQEKSTKKALKKFCFLLAVALLPVLAQAKIVYVTTTGAGNHSGTSWGNACTISEALWNDNVCINCNRHIAINGDEIWIKQGTYGQTPGRAGIYVNGVKLYGGFVGNETSLTQRNPALYKTILSGFTNSVNGGSVQTAATWGSVPVIDGVNFQDCYCSFRNDNVLNNCVFQGGKLYFSDVNQLNTTDCTFENTGALRFDPGDPKPVFTRCTFRKIIETSTSSRAPISCYAGGFFTSCVFDSNYTHSGTGGALYTQGSLTVENCLFINNGSAGSGGAIYLNSLGSTILNNTFVNNYCTREGSVIYDYKAENTIANNIMWSSNNSSVPLFTLSSLAYPYTDVLVNNIIKDGSGGGFTFDPQLDGNYNLSGCSPAINAGNGNYTGGPLTDLAGNTRTFGGQVDIGCYESQGPYLGKIKLVSSNTTICEDGVPILLQYSSSYSGPSTYYWYTNNNSYITTVPRLIVTPTSLAKDYYVSQVTDMGCVRFSDTVHINVYPANVAATTLLATPALSEICVGQNVKVTAQAGTGGTIGCSDYFRYSIDGGTIWQTYVPGTNINTSNANSKVIVQTRRGGCTNCSYTDWSTLASWYVKQNVRPTISITGSSNVQQAQPATFNTVITYGGTAPVYNWKLNGNTVGSNSPSYTLNAPANGDVLTCTLTSNYTDCMSTTIAADTIALSVNAAYITTPDLCVNQPITVHLTTTPSVVYWEHYSISPKPDTAYAQWEAASTTVVTGPGSFGGLYTDMQNNVYVADLQRNVVWKYAPGQSTGVVVAGNIATGAGSGSDQLNNPVDVFVDAGGNLFVLDALNYRVQKWLPGATSGTTVAGGNGRGFANNQFWSNLNSMKVTRGGNIYVADPGNSRIQVWSQGAASGATAVANVSATAFDVDDRGTDDTLYIANGNGSVLKWVYGAPSGVVVAGGHGIGSAGNQLGSYVPSMSRNYLGDIYITDRNNGRVQLWRRGATSGITVAGINGYGYLPTQLGDAWGMTLNNQGDIYVSQNPVAPGNAILIKFASQFIDTILLPSEPGLYRALAYSFSGLTAQTNMLDIKEPVTPAVSVTASNTVICRGSYVSFTPVAVNGGSSPLYKWYVNGLQAGTSSGVWVTAGLNAGDTVYCKLISSETCVTTDTALSNAIVMQPFIISVAIAADPSDVVCRGGAVTFTSHTLNGGSNPSFTWLVNGIVYGSDSIFTYSNPSHNDVVRCAFTSSSGCSAQPNDTSTAIVIKVSSGSLTASGVCSGSVLTDSSTIIPSILQWLRNDTLVRTVIPKWNNTGTLLLNQVYGNGLFRDVAGNIYIPDAGIPGVVKYAPGSSTGIIVAGGKGSGYTGDQMYLPQGVFVDDAGNIYVADFYRVTKWSAMGAYLGTVAGNGNPGTGPGQLDGASNVYFDKDGNLYVCDQGNARIQKFAPGSATGITVAGGNGLGGAANQTNPLRGMAVDAAGNLYVADYGNDRVQKWAPGANSGITVAGGHGRGTAPNQLFAPIDVYVDAAGNIFVTQANGAIALWQSDSTTGTTILAGTGASASVMSSTGDFYTVDRNNGVAMKYPVLSIADTFTANKGGVYKARMVNFSSCTFTTDTTTIYDIKTPSLSIAGDQGDTVCSGKLVTFSATALNAGPSPVYLWTKNGLPVGDSTNVYVANYVLQNDTIKCILQANDVCLSTNTASSNKIIMSVRQPVYGTGSAFINAGDTLYLGSQVITGSGTYVLTLASVYDCDSIVTTQFSLCTPIRDTVQATICTGDSVLLGAQVVTTAGAYSDTLRNAVGCDSIVTLILHVHPVYNDTFSQTICSNESFSLGGHMLTIQGTYTDTLQTKNGCDSIVTINLTVLPVASSNLNKSICAGSTYNFNGQALSMANVYYDTLTSANGCDSIVTLNLSVLPVSVSTLNQSICAGSTYNFNGRTLNADGIYYDTLTAANGCDSIITLNLSVNNPTHGTDVRVACHSLTWIDGNTYTANNNTATYTYTGGNVHGCDSVVTLNLTISNVITATDVKSACGSYTWIDGNTYTASNNTATYTYTAGSVQGCDSVVALKLTISTATTGTDVRVACHSLTWIDGNTYTANNNTATYTYTGGNAHGCDSVVTLNLTMSNIITATDVKSACGSYTWIDGNTYTSSNNTATYTMTGGSVQGCDSVVTLNLTINNATTGTDVKSACGSFTWIDGNTYTNSNNTATYTYTGGNAHGCDSVITLNLTINNATTSTDVKSACGSFIWIDGNTYTSSNNTATYTLPGSKGCDSVVTLNLTFNSTITSLVTGEFCRGTSYNFNGHILTQAGIYADTLAAVSGCDSIVTLTLNSTDINDSVTVSGTTCTVVQSNATYQWFDCTNGLAIANATNQSYTASSNGSFACIISESGCADTSSCTNINGVGIAVVRNYKFNLYPNPNNGLIRIEHSYEGDFQLRLLSSIGNLVRIANLTKQVEELDITDLAAGVYQAVLLSNNQQLAVIKLIKQ